MVNVLNWINESLKQAICWMVIVHKSIEHDFHLEIRIKDVNSISIDSISLILVSHEFNEVLTFPHPGAIRGFSPFWIDSMLKDKAKIHEAFSNLLQSCESLIQRHTIPLLKPPRARIEWISQFHLPIQPIQFQWSEKNLCGFSKVANENSNSILQSGFSSE